MRSQRPVVRSVEGESITQTVIETVAEAVDVDPIDLDVPLYEVIDPDSLEQLFEARNTVGQVQFTMAGCQIVVHSDGRIVVASQGPADSEGPKNPESR